MKDAQSQSLVQSRLQLPEVFASTIWHLFVVQSAVQSGLSAFHAVLHDDQDQRIGEYGNQAADVDAVEHVAPYFCSNAAWMQTGGDHFGSFIQNWNREARVESPVRLRE